MNIVICDDELDRCMDELVEKLHEEAEVVSIHGRDRTLEVPIQNILYFEGTPWPKARGSSSRRIWTISGNLRCRTRPWWWCCPT